MQTIDTLSALFIVADVVTAVLYNESFNFV